MTLAHELAQRATDLVITAQVGEIGAQKHITALPGDALFQPVLEAVG
jgi:hypothetical protein